MPEVVAELVAAVLKSLIRRGDVAIFLNGSFLLRDDAVVEVEGDTVVVNSRKEINRLRAERNMQQL